MYQPGVEPSVPHARVLLAGPVQREVYSNSHGWWQVGGLPPGQYTIILVPPSGYTVLNPNPLTYALQDRCEKYHYLHFALAPLPTPTSTPSMSKIQGYVWADANEDGIRQPNEPGIPGVHIYLKAFPSPFGQAGDNNREWETETDQRGFYQFDGLPPGTYTVTCERLGGAIATTQSVVEIQTGTTTVNVDFGIHLLGWHIYHPYIP